MNKHDAEKWSIVNIFIRIIAYPFCLTFILAGIYIAYVTLDELEYISKKESFIGFGLSIVLILIPFLYLYHDLKTIFSKNKTNGKSNILDDDL